MKIEGIKPLMYYVQKGATGSTVFRILLHEILRIEGGEGGRRSVQSHEGGRHQETGSVNAFRFDLSHIRGRKDQREFGPDAYTALIQCSWAEEGVHKAHDLHEGKPVTVMEQVVDQSRG